MNVSLTLSRAHLRAEQPEDFLALRQKEHWTDARQLATDSAIVFRDDAVVAVFDPCRKKALAIPDHYISGLPNPINPLSRLASMIARELVTTPSTASHFDFNVRAVPPTTPFWIAMYVASGLGC
jgi:hypothetical protein